MARLESLSKAILERLHDNDWMKPSWFNELKDTFSDIPARNIELIYTLRLKEKIDTIPKRILQNILHEQSTMNADNRNYMLQDLIREKLGLNKEP